MTDIDEYLRRNLLVAKAEGARAACSSAMVRLARTKRPAKWLMKALNDAHARVAPLTRELARHRDEVK